MMIEDGMFDTADTKYGVVDVRNGMVDKPSVCLAALICII